MSNINNIGSISDVSVKNRDIIMNVTINGLDGVSKIVELIPGVIYNIDHLDNGKRITTTGKYVKTFIEGELVNTGPYYPSMNDIFDYSENNPSFNENSFFSFDISDKFSSDIKDINIINIIDIVPVEQITEINPEENKSFVTIIDKYTNNTLIENNREVLIIDPINKDEFTGLIKNNFSDKGNNKSIIITTFEDIDSAEILKFISGWFYTTINDEYYFMLKKDHHYSITQNDVVIVITELFQVY